MAGAYRWETLRKLREEACDQAAAALARAADERARHEEAVRLQGERLREAEARLGAHREASLPKQGEAFRGADWQRARAFEQRLVSERDQQDSALAETRARLMGARKREKEALEALGRARQAREVLERDRERVEAERRRDEGRREEAEAEDLVAARWRRD
ncbi:MAG: hypothetical protein RBU30_26880 [Polyangia bacterium]|jgi:flagellar biosynthesis chaperone FliJ|nr:hypothetical protein [Polyangia bacterium]